MTLRAYRLEGWGVLGSAHHVHRFLINTQVTLAAGYVLFFYSERLFWTTHKPGDTLGDFLLTWLAYSVLACVLLNVVVRGRAFCLARMAIAGAVYGWLAEGALVGTLYGTEPSAPFPLSIVQTALSWHMLISVLLGFYLLPDAVRHGRSIRTALISLGVGCFWGLWAPFQWRETPPIITSVPTFALHAVVCGVPLILCTGWLASRPLPPCKPGVPGLLMSSVVLLLFYSQQVMALGLRALVVLPALVGGALLLLAVTRPVPLLRQPDSRDLATQWKTSLFVGLAPVTAITIYAAQLLLGSGIIRPDFIFWALAVMGVIIFLIMSVRVVLAHCKDKSSIVAETAVIDGDGVS